MDTAVSILVSFLGGGAAATLIKVVGDLILRRWKNAHAITRVLKDVNNLYDILNALKANTDCTRAMVSASSNGGGIPRVGSVLKATMVYEVYDGHREAMKSAWKERQLDQEYVKVLAELEQVEDGLVIIVPENLGRGLLKESLQAQEVEAAAMCRIKATNDKYYYLTCHFEKRTDIDIQAIIDVKDSAAMISRLIQ